MLPYRLIIAVLVTVGSASASSKCPSGSVATYASVSTPQGKLMNSKSKAVETLPDNSDDASVDGEEGTDDEGDNQEEGNTAPDSTEGDDGQEEDYAEGDDTADETDDNSNQTAPATARSTEPQAAQKMQAAPAPAAISKVSGKTFTGDGTYYTAGRGNNGACSIFDPVPFPNTLAVVAMNHEQWDSAAWCGSCIQIKGKVGTVIARVVDKCPSPCKYGDIDMGEELFPSVDQKHLGRVKIEWSAVECPGTLVSGAVEYKIKSGSTRYWLSIQPRNHRSKLRSIELSCDQGRTWRQMQRTDYNEFIISNLPDERPFWLRTTNEAGKSVVEQNIPLQVGVVKGKQSL